MFSVLEIHPLCRQRVTNKTHNPNTVARSPTWRGRVEWCQSWWWTLTLLDTPLQLCEDIFQQDFTEGLVKLCKHVTDGVQSVVARRRHPLSFLQTKRDHASISLFISPSWVNVYGIVNYLTPTSVCCSGSFMLSKMRKTILKRSCHQCFSNVRP